MAAPTCSVPSKKIETSQGKFCRFSLVKAMHPHPAVLQQLGRTPSYSVPTTGKFPSVSKWFHRVIENDCNAADDVEQDDEIVHMVFSKEKQEDYIEKRLTKALKEWENETSLCVGMY